MRMRMRMRMRMTSNMLMQIYMHVGMRMACGLMRHEHRMHLLHCMHMAC